MSKFSVKVGQEFDVRETLENGASVTNTQVVIQIGVQQHPEKKESKKPSLLMIALASMCLLVFASIASATTFGYFTDDFSLLETITKSMHDIAVDIAKGLLKK